MPNNGKRRKKVGGRGNYRSLYAEVYAETHPDRPPSNPAIGGTKDSKSIVDIGKEVARDAYTIAAIGLAGHGAFVTPQQNSPATMMHAGQSSVREERAEKDASARDATNDHGNEGTFTSGTP